MSNEDGREEKPFSLSGEEPSIEAGEEARAQAVWAATEAGDYRALHELLTENPALIGVRDEEGASLLHLAAMSGDASVIDLLLETGIDINIANGSGQTPLHHAAWNGLNHFATLLLERGADVFTEDEVGDTPASYATEAGHQEVADLLNKAEQEASDLSEYEETETAAVHQDAPAPAIREDGVLLEDQLCRTLDAEVVAIESAARRACDVFFLRYLIDNEDLDATYTDDDTDDDFDRIVNDGFLANYSDYEERITALAFYQMGYTNALRNVVALLQGKPNSITAPARGKFVGVYEDAPDLSYLTNKQKATLKHLLSFSPIELPNVIKDFRKRDWG